MLNTITNATFYYHGHTVTARRTVDTASGKFFCWYGELDDVNAIAHRSLQQFEKKFRDFVDKAEDNHYDPTTQA